MRLGILASHPIQYQAPWFRTLAKAVDLEVLFAHRQSAAEQGKAGFGVAFEWDVDLLSGYQHRFLTNVSRSPGVSHYSGCDTPEVADIIGEKLEDRSSKMEVSRSPISQLPSPSPEVSGQWSVVSGRRGNRFDAFIVSGWNLKSYWQAIRACRRAGVPVLVRGDSQLRTPRSLLKRLAMEVRQRWLLRQFDGFLSVGQRHREYLEYYGVPAKKIFFAPHFVDNEWFAAKAAEVRSLRSKVRTEWGAGEADLVALFVGKFIPKKRPADLLRAVARLKLHPGGADLPVGQDAQQPVSTVRAVFVGSGELENELHAAAKALGVQARFEGFKNQSELPALYAAADALILPSDGGETWGLVVNEAMACGLPAIVTDAVGCGPDLIEEGRTGFTYPVGDVNALSRKLQQIAAMRLDGEAFQRALVEKLHVYSVNTAVAGAVRAVTSILSQFGTPPGEGAGPLGMNQKY